MRILNTPGTPTRPDDTAEEDEDRHNYEKKANSTTVVPLMSQISAPSNLIFIKLF
jgi:hypothetical protein